MRLTLRTLLAYLDDALEPAQAKLIGQKVAESEAAQELIGRIKLVTRRRRLTTPPLSGPGAKFDPDTIAAYLDNVLPAEQVTELEETCLASDVHLAEVAACHQVLTLFLGEPALVPPTARQRMYGLIRGREAIPNRKVAVPTAGAGQAAAEGHEEETLPTPRADLASSTNAPAETDNQRSTQPSPPPEPPAKPKSPTAQPVSAPSTERAELGKTVLVSPAVLLQRPADRETWQRLKPNTRVFSHDYLVSLPGYR